MIEVGEGRGENWRARGLVLPVKEEIAGGAADSSLAGAHAAAGLEFGFSGRFVMLKLRERDVFAAADDGLIVGESFQFIAEGEGFLQSCGEVVGSFAGAEEVSGGGGVFGGDVACDLAFDDGFVEAAYAGGFAGGVDVGEACLLSVIHRDGGLIACEIAAEQGGQFQIRDEEKTAGEIIAGHLDWASGRVERDLELMGALGGADRPATGLVGDANELGF